MIEVSNLRKEKNKGWVILKCDFNHYGEGEWPYSDNVLWLAVEEKNEDMLTTEVYDPFVLVPLMLGMYYGQDVHIKGDISPRLYHNIRHYIINIFDRFSDYNRIVNFEVDGFKIVHGPSTLIGTGISCGVDSLVTIYDNFIQETDENFKINSLFFFNYGSHGDFEDSSSHKRWEDRITLNMKCAEELNLPVYLVDTNFHAYTHRIGEPQMGYLANYSCILALQNYIKRYMTSANLSYDEIMIYRDNSRDFDFAEYCESFFPHLVSTEGVELVIDGCQYTRAQKIERISEWKIAQKYLNVCIHPVSKGHNCSNCEKCMWTLIPLEAMGKLDKFKDVFDIGTYNRNSRWWKSYFMTRHSKDSMETSVIDYARGKGLKVHSKVGANITCFYMRVLRKLKKIVGVSNG